MYASASLDVFGNQWQLQGAPEAPLSSDKLNGALKLVEGLGYWVRAWELGLGLGLLLSGEPHVLSSHKLYNPFAQKPFWLPTMKPKPASK